MGLLFAFIRVSLCYARRREMKPHTLLLFSQSQEKAACWLKTPHFTVQLWWMCSSRDITDTFMDSDPKQEFTGSLSYNHTHTHTHTQAETACGAKFIPNLLIDHCCCCCSGLPCIMSGWPRCVSRGQERRTHRIHVRSLLLLLPLLFNTWLTRRVQNR